MPENNRLMLAITISMILHGIVLSLHFAFPEASRALQKKALDVILVNAKTKDAPLEAKAIAQANLDGGGNTDEDRRVKTPLPLQTETAPGEALEQTQKRIEALEIAQKRLASELSQTPTSAPKKAQETEPKKGKDLAETALAMARLEGEISMRLEEYSKRPRRKFLGASTRESNYAQYVEGWRQKVERVGTLNYPPEAKGKLYGSLLLTVAIRADGSVERVQVVRSSGYAVLDKAAVRIVKLSEPFAPFPLAIQKETDILEITRSWSFTHGDHLSAD